MNSSRINFLRGAGIFLLLVCLAGKAGAQGSERDSQSIPYKVSLMASPGGDAHAPFRVLTPVTTGRPGTSLFQAGKPPVFSIKTNLLYAATLTPNLGFEIGLGRKTTLEISGGYNPWEDDEKQLKHWLVKPEFKYWLSERFSGHYFSAHGFYADFDIHGIKFPQLLKKEMHNKGTAFGGGLSYGYHWVWSKRWGLDFNVGAGVLKTDYKERACETCETEVIRYKKTYFGPVSAGLKLIFIIR